MKLLVKICSIFIFSSSLYAYGNSFTCPVGTDAACLDYGDKVCSSFSKCVSDDAVCFDSYTCGYKGFVCKSKYDDLVDEYDDLVRKYNTLLQNYNNRR